MYINIPNILQQGEGGLVEFKSSFNEDVTETLVAFSNAKGGMIERYGSGIMRIHKICKEYGVNEPDFNEVLNGFQVILYNERIVEINTIANVTENVGDFSSNYTNNVDNVTDRAKRVFRLIPTNNRISISEIAKHLKVTKRTVLRDIERLKNGHLLERIGSEIGGYWKIKKRYVR